MQCQRSGPGGGDRGAGGADGPPQGVILQLYGFSAPRNLLKNDLGGAQRGIFKCWHQAPRQERNEGAEGAWRDRVRASATKTALLRATMTRLNTTPP